MTQELERRMSYRDILLLRKEARGWRLEDMGEEPPAVDPPLDPDFMRGLSSDDPQVLRRRVSEVPFPCAVSPSVSATCIARAL